MSQLEPLTPSTPEPAAPVAPAEPSAILESLSSADRETWRQTGKVPGYEPKAPDAIEQADEDADDEPAAPVATPAVDPAVADTARKAAGISKRQQQINDLIREKTQTAAERDALKAELEGLKAGRKPEPVAAPAKPDAAKAPTIDEFLNEPDPWAAFTSATARYEARELLKAERAEEQQRRQQEQAQSAEQKAFSTYQERETAFKAANPDYDAATLDVRNQIFPRTPIFDVVMDSPIGPAMIRHFADHLDVFSRIAQLQTVNPYAALRELGKLEAQLENKASSASAAAVTPKTVTSAPAPPTTLGSRIAEPADAYASAITRKDQRAYNEEANRRDAARLKR